MGPVFYVDGLTIILFWNAASRFLKVSPSLGEFVAKSPARPTPGTPSTTSCGLGRCTRTLMYYVGFVYVIINCSLERKWEAICFSGVSKIAPAQIGNVIVRVTAICYVESLTRCRLSSFIAVCPPCDLMVGGTACEDAADGQDEPTTGGKASGQVLARKRLFRAAEARVKNTNNNTLCWVLKTGSQEHSWIWVELQW